MSLRLSALSIALTVFTLVFTSHAAATVLAHKAQPVSLSRDNLSSIFEALATEVRNITHSSKNFLGVNCYNLPDATVNLNTCQTLFALLFEAGHVYDENAVPNGWRFRYDQEPCVITVSSPTRGDRRVKMSVASLVLYATDILQTCRELSNGGAYTFQGTWQVIVTRGPVIITLGNGSLAED